MKIHAKSRVRIPSGPIALWRGFIPEPSEKKAMVTVNASVSIFLEAGKVN
jgi:hypothetical protein